MKGMWQEGRGEGGGVEYSRSIKDGAREEGTCAQRKNIEGE